VGYGSNLEHVIGVINKVGSDWLLTLYGKITLFFLLNFDVNDFADSSIMLKILGETLPSKQWE
jgi:small conductance mechanosensitive channel